MIYEQAFCDQISLGNILLLFINVIIITVFNSRAFQGLLYLLFIIRCESQTKGDTVVNVCQIYSTVDPFFLFRD